MMPKYGILKKYYLFPQHLKREIVKCLEKNAMEPYPQGVLGCYGVHNHSRHLSFFVVIKVNPQGVNITSIQGCISCGILVSGIRARGVSSEHMENMEMFSCSPT